MNTFLGESDESITYSNIILHILDWQVIEQVELILKSLHLEDLRQPNLFPSREKTGAVRPLGKIPRATTKQLVQLWQFETEKLIFFWGGVQKFHKVETLTYLDTIMHSKIGGMYIYIYTYI